MTRPIWSKDVTSGEDSRLAPLRLLVASHPGIVRRRWQKLEAHSSRRCEVEGPKLKF